MKNKIPWAISVLGDREFKKICHTIPSEEKKALLRKKRKNAK